MFSVVKNSWALFLGVMLLMMGNSLQGTLLGVRGSYESFDSALMGYIMSMYFIGLVIGAWVTPYLLRRVGHVRVFAALGSLISAAFIIYAVIVDPIAWGLMRLVVGICFSGVYIVSESWLNDAATNETRGQTLSAYLIVQMAGVIAGQFLLGIGDPRSFELFVLISVIVSISFAPILLSVSPAPIHENSEKMTIRELFKASPLGCVTAFLVGGVFSAMFGMAAVYAGEKGYSLPQISLFVSMLYIGGLISQYPIGWLSDRMDRRRLITICAFAGAVGSLLGVIGGDEMVFAFGSAFLLGAMASPLYGLAIAYTNDFLDNAKMSSASSGLIFMNAIGAIGGPVLVGYMMQIVGPEGFFAFTGALMLVTSGYALYRMTQRAAPNADDTAPYAPVPRTSYVAAEMAQEVVLEAIEEEEAAAEARERESAS